MNILRIGTLSALLSVGFVGAAHALTITDPGVVGAAGNDVADNANVPQATSIANTLLLMGANQINPSGCTLQPDNNFCYQTGPVDYNATLVGGTRVESGNLTNVSGYTWVLAKYDGPNAGYVLFNVADYGGTIPQLSTGIWTNSAGQGYDVSNFTGWTTTNTVPDGGATALMLGGGLGLIGIVRRRQRLS